MALLRRCFPQILRSIVGYRMLSVGVSRSESPWLLMRRDCNLYSCTHRMVFKHYRGGYFQSRLEYRHPDWEGAGLYVKDVWGMETVGSSHGWLALSDANKRRAWLFDPTSYESVMLPNPVGLGSPCSVTLSERAGPRRQAFMICGESRRLAFCWPNNEWRMFGQECGYESFVYSSRGRRLSCLTSTSQLETWDVDDGGGGGAPRLASVTPPFEFELELPEQHQHLKYIVEEEESGELFVVVRRVKIGQGTVGFEVYKNEGGVLIHMDRGRGLDGMVMFVGVNNPIVLKDGDAVEPNSIYFAYDNRILADAVSDHGIYDYATARVSPVIQPDAVYDDGIYDYATACHVPFNFSPVIQPPSYQPDVPPVWLAPPIYYNY